MSARSPCSAWSKFAGPTAQRRVRPREQLLTYPYNCLFDSSDYPYNCSFDSSILRYLDSLLLRDLGGAGSPRGISKSSQNPPNTRKVNRWKPTPITTRIRPQAFIFARLPRTLRPPIQTRIRPEVLIFARFPRTLRPQLPTRIRPQAFNFASPPCTLRIRPQALDLAHFPCAIQPPDPI